MNTPWMYDVVTEHAALTTTGGRVWDAARRLCSYLEEMGPQLGLTRPGLRVLELGSGLGWLGMTLARNLKGPDLVVLTEQEEGGGLDWLRHNLSLNAHLPGMKVVRAEACDWRLYGNPRLYGPGLRRAADQPRATGGVAEEHPVGCAVVSSVAEGDADCCNSRCPEGHQPGEMRGVHARESNTYGMGTSSSGGGHGADGDAGCANGDCGYGASGGIGQSGDWLTQQRWDLILGSDLVYNEIGAECLPRVIRALAGPNTRILYCHTKHRFDTHDMRFFEELGACGLVCAEVHEPSVASPPPSPPPLTELFPEMRIALYDIHPAALDGTPS